MNNSYVIEYLNENDYRKKERAIKKYNMLAYKKLQFDYYPKFRDGEFLGVSINSENSDILKYELKLPSDSLFNKVHGDIVLHYSVYLKQNIVMLDDLTTSDDILIEGHEKELMTYKGVMVSKKQADKDIFKINLINMLEK